MNLNFIKLAKEVVDSADSTGCSDDLIVASKKAIRQLEKSLIKLPKNPMDFARSVWKCPTCGKKVFLTFSELGEVGYPLCREDDCKCQMYDLVAIEIYGEVFPLEYTTCKE